MTELKVRYHNDTKRFVIYDGKYTYDRWRLKDSEWGHHPISFKTLKAANAYIDRFEATAIRRTTWSSIWGRALQNTPQKKSIQKKIMWVKLDSITVPDFIKGSAKQYMQMLDGEVHERHVITTERLYGRVRALAILMDFWIITHRGLSPKRPHGMGVHTAWRRGTVPRDPEKAKLLQRLAQSDGKQVALQLLTQRGYPQYKW